MSKLFCPLCYTPLEIRDVAPCANCGHLPEEIDHFLTHQHTYDLVRLFGRFTLVLCDFCQFDFYSYDPSFFGLPRHANLHTLAQTYLLKRVEETRIQKDWYCPDCAHRLAFLAFVDQCRKAHQAT